MKHRIKFRSGNPLNIVLTTGLVLVGASGFLAGTQVQAQAARDGAANASAPAGDSVRGKVLFQQDCALCHAVSQGPGIAATAGVGPSVLGILGHRAGSDANFSYSKALGESRLVWDSATLDRFLANPMAVAPGTTMLVPIPEAGDRRDLIAYMATLTAPAGVSPAARPGPAAEAGPDAGDWRNDAPGVKHRVNLAALPAPYATTSAGNGPQVVPRPANAALSVPPNFTVRLFAGGLSGPRLLRVAPNGDIFIAETSANRIRVMRAADGADAPSENQVFADGLDRPFGIAFYPSGDDPQWIYAANNNAVVRFAYRSGDLKARGTAQILVPSLTDSRGGHTTRDVAFSKDGRRMFISVGSGSNVAEEMSKKSGDAARLWEAGHGRGAAWDAEFNRAEILATDPEGRQPLRAFATGIRNGVGLAVDGDTGELWTLGQRARRSGRRSGSRLHYPRQRRRILWLALVLFGQSRRSPPRGRASRTLPARPLSPTCRCRRIRPRWR